MLQKCLCTLARFVRCRLFRSLWTLFIASVRVVILSFQFRAAPLILNVTSKTSHKINNVGSFLNDSLCLKLHFMPRWWCSLYISSLNRLHLIWHFFSYLHYVLAALGRHYYSSRCVLIYSLTSWFAPLFSHSLHCVELFFLCAATLPVWFLICVAKQWLPGKSLSYISHWFP